MVSSSSHLLCPSFLSSHAHHLLMPAMTLSTIVRHVREALLPACDGYTRQSDCGLEHEPDHERGRLADEVGELPADRRRMLADECARRRRLGR